MTHPTPILECKTCRHDGDEDLPFSACKACKNMSNYSIEVDILKLDYPPNNPKDTIAPE